MLLKKTEQQSKKNWRIYTEFFKKFQDVRIFENVGNVDADDANSDHDDNDQPWVHPGDGAGEAGTGQVVAATPRAGATNAATDVSTNAAE